VLIRPVHGTDAPLLADGFARLSARSRQMRFLMAKRELSPAELRYFTEIDHHDHEALGAVDRASGRGVGVARYVRSAEDARSAEIAVTVVDEWQGRGLGTAALAESPDKQHLLTALGMLDELDAKPLATVVRRRLRALGVTRIPRGPLGETRVNPAGLTARQIDVLRLLGKGYTNAQIASQLVVSVRTVDSHVAAVLSKLGTATRREAAARAAELGALDTENR